MSVEIEYNDEVMRAEIEAGQMLAERLQAQLLAIGACPICSARIDPFVGVFHHADGCVLEAYEVARKANDQ